MGSRINMSFAEEAIRMEPAPTEELGPARAKEIPLDLAGTFLSNSSGAPTSPVFGVPDPLQKLPDISAAYRALVEREVARDD